MEDYTVEGMLLELAKKIKKIKFANGETMVTELSRRQRTIPERFGAMRLTFGRQGDEGVAGEDEVESRNVSSYSMFQLICIV